MQQHMGSVECEENPYVKLDERAEEPWLQQQEDLIAAWRKEADTLAAAHGSAGKKAKRLRVLYGLPPLVIPAVMTPVSAAFKDASWVSYIEMVAFMLTGITGAVSTFFNYAGKTEKHFAFSARYADLVTDIDQEMVKPRRFRQQVDTFSLRVKMTYDALNRAAPDV